MLLINFINASALKGNFASGNKQSLDFFPNQKKRAGLLLTAEKVHKQFIKTLTLTLRCVIVVDLPHVWKEVENKPTKPNLPLVMSQWD